jgi:hypothetical protein
MIRTYAVAIVAIAMMLVGCADQSGINGPIGSGQASAVFTGSFDANSTQITTIDVDAVVTDEKSGESYAVRGSVLADFYKGESVFILTTQASLTVSKEPDGKEYTGAINAGNVDKGVISNDIQVTRSYKLPGLPAGSYLTLHFRVVNEPIIEAMEIRVAKDDSGIEGE